MGKENDKPDKPQVGGKKTEPVWLLVSGPSGVGKSTLIERMLKAFSAQLQLVVTATTRAMRPGEENGKQYYFMSREEFDERKAAGEFLETTEQYGRCYGILRAEVEKKLTAGTDLIMHVTWQGRHRLEDLARGELWMKRALTSVFIKPVSMEDLRTRIERRGRNTPEEIEARLKMAQLDTAYASECRFIITSGTLEEDFEQIKGIYLGLRDGK